LCVMSSFRREVHEKFLTNVSGQHIGTIFKNRNCALLDYYSARSGRVLIMGPAGYPKTSVTKYNYTLRNSLEESSSGVEFVSTIPVICNNTPSSRGPHNY